MTLQDSSHNTSLKQLLERPGIIRSLGAHDVFTALIVERLGFETVFIGGFGASASRLGLPDLNLITMTEMAEAVGAMAHRVAIPVVADGDTGHGGTLNVRRTVQEFERAGAGGILIEDQVAPKRCGHFAGKEVVSTEEFASRIRAALDARVSPDFVIIARTDARSAKGLDEAVERANLSGELGADCVFIEAPESVEELREIPERVPYPLLANMLYGGITPILTVSELEALGYKIAVFPIESLAVTARAVERLGKAILSDGHLGCITDEMASFDEIKEILGLSKLLDTRKRLESRG